MPLSTALDITSRPLQPAVDALLQLDNGNRMVEKCAAFLDRLGRLLPSLSISTTMTFCIASVADNCAASGFSDTNQIAYTSLIPGSVALDISMLQNRDTDMRNNPPMYMQEESPLGIELGEFMMESDLDFLNYFSIPPSVPNDTNTNGGMMDSQGRLIA
jgi:hypothetical protein